MKKVIPFCLALFTSLSAYASTPIERVMLINGLETWLKDGESLLNWSEFRHGKKVVESPNAYSLVKIYYDFRRNVFAAEKEYKGVIQRTRMPFSSVERNNRGEPIVIFVTDKLTDQDMINYVQTVADKMSENTRMMTQIHNNPREQAMLGEFDTALDDAVLDSNTAHMEQMTQLMSDPAKMKQFAHIIYDVLVSQQKQNENR